MPTGWRHHAYGVEARCLRGGGRGWRQCLRGGGIASCLWVPFLRTVRVPRDMNAPGFAPDDGKGHTTPLKTPKRRSGAFMSLATRPGQEAKSAFSVVPPPRRHGAYGVEAMPTMPCLHPVGMGGLRS